MTNKRHQCGFIPHQAFFMSNLKKNIALPICFYFNEMLACLRSRASHQGFWKSAFFRFFQWNWFYPPFGLHRSSCAEVWAGPAASWPCTRCCISSWCWVRSGPDRTAFCFVHPCPWKAGSIAAQAFADGGDTAEMPSDDSIGVWATKAVELCCSVTLCPRLWTKPCLKLKQGALLPCHTQPRPRDAQKVAFLFLFHRKLLAVENMSTNWVFLPYSVGGWLSDLGVRTW